MSIVIASIDHNLKGVLMASDNRCLDLDGNFKNDDNIKVFKIRAGVMYSMSGIASECERLRRLLDASKELPASKLIKIASEFKDITLNHKDRLIGNTFMLAGEYDDGQPFCWSKTSYKGAEGNISGYHLGQSCAKTGNLTLGQPCIMVSAPKDATVKKVHSIFYDLLNNSNGDYTIAIAKAIKIASKMDSAISPSLDMLIFDVEGKKMYETHVN